MCYQYEAKYVLIHCAGIQDVGEQSQNWVAKHIFSNQILTKLTYFLYASTMYKHIFGLILVTQKILGVQLDYNNRFSII